VELSVFHVCSSGTLHDSSSPDPSAAKADLILLYFKDGLKPVPFKPTLNQRSMSVTGLLL